MISLTGLEALLKGLADASRLRILNLLLYGELCGCDIQIVLGMTQSNVSRHLSYLKHSGLVTERRDGFRVFHALSDSTRKEWKALFEFLRAAFRVDPVFQDDLFRLRQAIRDGACKMQQLVPLPAASRSPSRQRKTIRIPARTAISGSRMRQ